MLPSSTDTDSLSPTLESSDRPGRKRLEPLAVVVLSVIMGLASLQLIQESIEKIIGLADATIKPPSVELPTIAISVVTIVTKFGLFLVCRKGQSPTVQALAQDHRNDVLSNTLAIICGYIGSQEMQQISGLEYLVHVDPIGAIAISLYIAVTWYITGKDSTKALTGSSATPEVVNKLTLMCLNHHKDIVHIHSIKAFHCGYHYQVEVCISMRGESTISYANDITSELQKKLEKLFYVESAMIFAVPEKKKLVT